MTEEVKAEEFSTDNIPKSNWMQFKTVGDWIIGTYNRKSVKKGLDEYPDQMVYVMTNVKINGEQKEITEEYNMGVAIRADSANFVNNKFAKLVPGQRLGLKFEKEIPPKRKGFRPAKSFLPNVFGMDPNYVSPETFTNQDEINIDDVPFKS